MKTFKEQLSENVRQDRKFNDVVEGFSEEDPFPFHVYEGDLKIKGSKFSDLKCIWSDDNNSAAIVCKLTYENLKLASKRIKSIEIIGDAYNPNKVQSFDAEKVNIKNYSGKDKEIAFKGLPGDTSFVILLNGDSEFF